MQCNAWEKKHIDSPGPVQSAHCYMAPLSGGPASECTAYDSTYPPTNHCAHALVQERTVQVFHAWNGYIAKVGFARLT